MSTATTIRPARAADAPAICAIYNHFVRDTIVKFEESPVADSEMAVRIAQTTRQYPWLQPANPGATGA